MPAELIVHKTYINMIPGVSPPPVINVSQYDDGFAILLYPVAVSRGVIPKYPAPVASDTPLNYIFPTGVLHPTVEVRGTKTDGNGYSAAAAYNGANDAFYIAGNKQMTAVAGDNIFEVVVTADDGETELATANFILRVEKAALDKDTIVSESVIRELIEVTDQAEAIVAAAQQILSAIDATLTQQGKAADAKAVGDALANLSVYTFTDANHDGHIVISGGSA